MMLAHCISKFLFEDGKTEKLAAESRIRSTRPSYQASKTWKHHVYLRIPEWGGSPDFMYTKNLANLLHGTCRLDAALSLQLQTYY
jgi:hypothetical protein